MNDIQEYTINEIRTSLMALDAKIETLKRRFNHHLQWHDENVKR